MSTDRGSAQASSEQTVTVHLEMRDKAAFDSNVEALYTPGSPIYHQWLTEKELIAKYAPAKADVQIVKRELESHGLRVLSVASDNLSIRARGTVSQLEDTFATKIDKYELNGKTFNANAGPATMGAGTSSLVHAVSGLSTFPLNSHIMHPLNLQHGTQKGKAELATKRLTTATAVTTLGQNYTNDCFLSAGATSLYTKSPTTLAQFYGNGYVGSDFLFGSFVDTSSTPITGCGWTPAQIQEHYGLAAAYKKGLDGTGQSVVLVEGPSQASMQADLIQYSKLAGLPAITSSNFQIVYPEGAPTAKQISDGDWTEEADLDIEMVHAVAPQANIVVVVMPTENWSDLEYGILYATLNKLGNTISNSYGEGEDLVGASAIAGFDQVLEVSAAQGVTVNFSSGDSGDNINVNTIFGLLPFGTKAPSYPSSSPYGTAVGGTSLAIPKTNGQAVDTGWGTQLTLFNDGGPATGGYEALGFEGGSGGGLSLYEAKPSWQSKIAGSMRQAPDIAAIADPLTGPIIVYSGGLTSIGGTSASCPVFSAIWALADEAAGKQLGQAAPLLATMPSDAITDTLPLYSATDVTGTYTDSTGTTSLSANDLLNAQSFFSSTPQHITTKFYSATTNATGGSPFIVIDADTSSQVLLEAGFNLDTSLTVAKGWDNVTGWGSPNGLNFINAAVAAK